MKRALLTGCLLAGCATMGPRDDEVVGAQAKRAVVPPSASKVASGAVKVKTVEVPVFAEARLDGANEATVTGAARFAVDRGVVTMDLVVKHVTPGVHAVALQDSCDAEHWNPTNTAHGRFDVAPFHLGDVGNFFADANGKGTIIFSTELWSVGTGLSNDVVGKYIVVAEKKDDFQTQPEGGSGKLVSCGRIELSQLTRPAVSMMGNLVDR